jgi:hypothetical protein
VKLRISWVIDTEQTDLAFGNVIELGLNRADVQPKISKLLLMIAFSGKSRYNSLLTMKRPLIGRIAQVDRAIDF